MTSTASRIIQIIITARSHFLSCSTLLVGPIREETCRRMIFAGQIKKRTLASDSVLVADYLKRQAIELLIKDEKQQLGPSDHRILRYPSVVHN